MSFDVEFDTLVLHCCIVYIESAVTYRRSYITREEHVVRLLVEVVEGDVQPFLERNFQTEVNGGGALPCQTRSSSVTPYISLLVVYVLYVILVGIEHITDILVTQHTPAQTQLTVLQPVCYLCSFHEVLVGETPCAADRTEMTPALTLCELGRTIRTVVSRDVITAVILIRSGRQSGLQRACTGITLYSVHRNTVAQHVRVIFYNILLITVLHVICEVRRLVTGHQTNRMLVETLVVL